MNTATQNTRLIRVMEYAKWRHRIELFPGFYTPGYNTMPDDWKFNHFPDDLTGKSVLDVGANDGYFAFEAEKRGASRVCAMDIYGGDGQTMYEGWDDIGILLAKEYLNSTVDVKNLSVYDLDKVDDTFDYVLCSDVLSWLENVEEALKKLCHVCKEKIFIKDEFLTGYGSRPVLLYRGRKNSVTYRMNVQFVREQLGKNGFKIKKIHPINSRKHIEWQVENFPAVFANNSVEVFKYPGGEVMGSTNLNGEWLLAKHEGYGFIFRKGWVRLADIRIEPRFRNNVFKSILKKLIPENWMDWYYSRGDSEKKISAYMIEAERK